MEIIKLGDMDNSDGSFECCNRVYSPKGLSPTISAHNSTGDIKILQKTNGIRNRKQMVLGTENTIFDYGREKDIERLENATDGNHSAKLNKMPNGHLDSIDSAEICDIDHPLASTVCARYYKGIGGHKDNLVQNKVVKTNILVGGLQENQSVKTDGISTTLCSAMGEGGGFVPMTVEKVNHPEVAETICAGYYKAGEATLTRENGVSGNVAIERIPTDTIRIKQATKEGFVEMKLGGVCDLTYPTSTTRRGRVQEGGEVAPTLTVSGELHRIESLYRIRKLTPKECWRLMGFSDEDFHKAESVNSNTQLYKEAGNSIVKDVLMAIFKQLNIHQA